MRNLITIKNLLWLFLSIAICLGMTTLFNIWVEYDRAVALGTLTSFAFFGVRYAYLRFTKNIIDVNSMVAGIAGIILCAFLLCL